LRGSCGGGFGRGVTFWGGWVLSYCRAYHLAGARRQACHREKDGLGWSSVGLTTRDPYAGGGVGVAGKWRRLAWVTSGIERVAGARVP
jgi:hypothetical protein